MIHEAMMAESLNEARAGFAESEVPIGAVVVLNGRVIGKGHNQKERLQDPTAHAEIMAVRDACQNLKSWRLDGASLYTTAEPCLMCLGAALQARVAEIIYGCREPKFGAVELLESGGFIEYGNHRLAIKGGFCAEECAAILREFFAERRGLGCSPRAE